MENKNETRIAQEMMPAPQVEIQSGGNGTVLPSTSPNPGGWLKKTEGEQDALEEIRRLAPSVAGHMVKILNNPHAPAIAKVRILEIILERTYGKPEASIKLNADIRSNEAARARLDAIAARIRMEIE